MTHHADCDGFVMHSVSAKRDEFDTYIAECPICGILPMVGSSSNPQTAIALNREHAQSHECDGRCNSWT